MARPRRWQTVRPEAVSIRGLVAAAAVALIGVAAGGCGMAKRPPADIDSALAPAVAQATTDAASSGSKLVPKSAPEPAQPANSALHLSRLASSIATAAQSVPPPPPPTLPTVSPPPMNYAPTPPTPATPPARAYPPMGYPPGYSGSMARGGAGNPFFGQQGGSIVGMSGGGMMGMGGGMMGMGGMGGFAGGIGGVPRAAVPPMARQPVPRPPVGEQYDRQNAERYGHYRENEFRSPRVAPLSTFSADVNTASYSNVRRFLLDRNQLPPADAVFLAEFVNYFPYSYPQPKSADPVAFDLELGPCPWDRTHLLARVGAQARQIDPADMPLRSLTFLIDTSGSMSEPTRLPLVQKSLSLLIDRLTDKDTVGIVTYAGDSRIALPPTPGTQKEKIRAAVAELSAGGGTNGEGGIRSAYDLATRAFITGGVNRVILCTDGDFNVGVTDQGDLVRMIERYRRSGVFLTVLGYGMGNYQDDTLKELANHGNGHHAYIDSLDEARKVFVEQGGALAVVAKDVKFQAEFNPGRVAAYRLLGYENRLLKAQDFKNDKVDAGDIGSGHQVTVLYEIIPAGVKADLPGVDPLKYQAAAGPAPAASDEWLTAKMRYKAPDGDVSREVSRALAGEPGKEPSADFRFAAAVASFALLLRDSPHAGVVTYAGVVRDAVGCVGKDPGGHRRAFLDLVRRADKWGTRPAAGHPTPAQN